MQSTLTIKGKVIGQSRPAFPDWVIPLPPDLHDSGGRLTLRDLITRIVLQEVEAFRTRQEERRLTRVLSMSQIEQGVVAGKVDMGGRDLNQEVNPEAAVGAALQAFEDGLYFVFLDGAQQKDLGSEVFVRADSEMTFVRLVPLVGG
jgi:hypothetical protein